MNIYNLDLRHLRYFLAVAEELNFSRAAERLHICQPPLSQQIQEMEARLETKLFSRTKRKVELTKAGQHLVPVATKILRDLEDGLYMTRSIGRGHSGELKIGLIYSAPLVPAFGKCIKKFRAKSPSVHLAFREMRHEQLLQALKNKEIDVAFMWQTAPKADKALLTHFISNDPMSLFVSETHPLASKKLIDILDLSNETLFLTSLQTKMGFLQKLRELAHARNVALRISEEALHFPVVANMVASDSGIGILPAYVAHLATTKLIRKNIKGINSHAMTLPLAVLHLKNNENALISQFLECLE